MKENAFLDGVSHVDADVVERFVSMDNRLQKNVNKVRSRPLWRRVVAVAACLALIIGAVVLVPMLWKNGAEEGNADDNNRSVAPLVRNQAPSSVPWYLGDEASANASSGAVQELNGAGISVAARFVEVLPDTYTFFDDWEQTSFRLLRLEVVAFLHGTGEMDEFLFIVPVDFMTDYSLYDKFVMVDIAQYGYEYLLLYNQTQGCAEQIEMPFFGYLTYGWKSLGAKIMAFDSEGLIDMTLWESTEAWRESIGADTLKFFEGYTLERAEERERCSGCGYHFRVHSLAEVVGAAAEALEYIKDLENGLYVPALDGWKLYMGSEVWLHFKRYIDGFATNEGVTVDDSKYARWSLTRFTEEDEERLPDLRAAVQAVTDAYQAGNLTPPHYLGYEQARLWKYGILGWYAKTPDGVIGVVRVTWCYLDVDDDHYYDGDYYDDAYYIIEYGSDTCERIERDDLLERLGEYETWHIYKGEYDEYGKVRDMMAPMV